MGASYGLIFDVDGVIADTEAVNATASIRMFADLFGVRGIRREDFEAGLGRGADAYVLSAASVHGVRLTAEQVSEATKIREAYFLESLASEPLPAFPGVMLLIDAAMADVHWCVGIATSSTKAKSEAVLKSARVPYDRMAYINGNDVTRKKPDPQLFLLCAERLSIDPTRCCVIEDAPNGVEAAKAAGCACVAVTNSANREKLGQADLVVDSLSELTLETLARLIDAS